MEDPLRWGQAFLDVFLRGKNGPSDISASSHRLNFQAFEKASHELIKGLCSMQRLTAWLSTSIIRQFMVVFGTISALVAIVAIPALIVSLEVSGSGGAINVSGSLRMQSYKLALAISDPFQTEEDRSVNTLAVANEFGHRLMSKAIRDVLPSDEQAPLSIQYQKLSDRWQNEILPMAKNSVSDVVKRRDFVLIVPSFVEEVNSFVNALENRLNYRLTKLQWLLVMILVGAIIVTGLMLMWLQNGVFNPLLSIQAAAMRVRQGDFNVRLDSKSRNEIGRLSRNFDFMVEELRRLYLHLENEVTKKTLALNHYNEGLRWVNQVNYLLSEGNDIDWKELCRLFTQGKTLLGIEGLMLMARRGEDYVDLAHSEGYEAAPGEEIRFKVVYRRDSSGKPDHDAPANYKLRVKAQHAPLEAWVEEILSVLTQTLGRNLERIIRLYDDRRLAVLEERSTIARELHDSIAQSLTYTRMQLHRLKAFEAKHSDPAQIAKAISDVDEGVTTAYRQLREVLSAFRLKVSSSNLVEGIEETVDEFRHRTGIPVLVKADVTGLTLPPNAQVHFVHILGEALVNIEKHARASEVTITLNHEGDETVLRVRDNGIGIANLKGKEGHFGLSIMKERAQAIKGTLSIENNTPEAGATITLRMPADLGNVSPFSEEWHPEKSVSTE